MWFVEYPSLSKEVPDDDAPKRRLRGEGDFGTVATLTVRPLPRAIAAVWRFGHASGVGHRYATASAMSSGAPQRGMVMPSPSTSVAQPRVNPMSAAM
jgi:hypothetical protein